jgi:hypothetical protein
VTDEMFVGTAPSEESQQTTGEYIKGLYKENIPVHARVYLETLLGKKDPITAEDFTKEELADIEKLLSSKPAKGAVTEYSDYEKVRDLDREGRHSSDWLENLPSVGKTLGRFTYETLPDGRRVIKDTYDFYNTSRSINVQEFEEMGPAEKALAVFKRITADRSVMDPPFVKRAADVLGEAYIGRDGRPVKVEYDPKDLPVKRQDGSPSQGEISDDMFLGTRPSDFPETSPVDTAVSDFISSRSKLVTDPQEFFRVMGQNIEEYHSKPLREDPQKYLTEQLGPGALAGTVGKTAKQLFSSLPSSEAPFVGRLDEFVSSLPGAVQKDQFLNQLKGKFRDYDIGRAQEALADLPGNAKLTPFELLNRVKRVYDPTTFTTRIDLPKAEDDYQARTDNPFKTEEGFSQKPLGVIHLLQGVNPATSPDAAKLMAAYDDIINRLPGTNFYSFDKTDRNPVSLTQDIYKIANRAGLSSVKDLGIDVQTVLQNTAQSGSDWSKLVSAKTILGNPGSYKPEEIKEALSETARITGTLPEENVRSLQKIAEEINARRTAKQDYSDLESQYHKSFPYAFAEDLQMANRRLYEEHSAGKRQIKSLLEGLQKREGIKARTYRGQHLSLAEDRDAIRDPIAFSRFTEHTTDIPGLGKVDGIYVNELQSDRLDDIRKTGRMGGGPQEDITRLDKLDKQIGEAAKQLADYKTAMGFRFMNETDKAKISDFNSKLEGLNTKRNTLLDRIREGQYSLKESFAGMEESPQVIQQLMAKNAVAGAMQLGKRFVAFPGAESAQAQLYEKLPNNLKQVVKDLGPGFELRPITLPKPDTGAGGKGGDLTSYAIVWGDEAADRIKKQGVPFKDGGEVSTEDFIKRFSKGEISNDEFIQEMMVGTRPTDETTSPGILPPEIRQAVDVPLDFANLLIRGTAAVPIGGVAGLYKGITGGKYGTQEGVKEADTEAARMMAKITGEPKTQAAKDVLEFIGGKAQEYKLDAALPQLLTLPSPGPGAASALMRSYELAETPPSGVVKMPGGNWLKGQVESFVRPLKKDIPWTQDQLEEMPGVAKAEAPNLALNKFIETGLTRYIKNDMASAKDTLRNLADENTIKAGKAYNNDLRQVKKAYDRAEKIKAEGPRPNMLPGTWENAIEAQLGRARQLEEEANRKLNLELRHALPFPVLQEDGELAGGLNFHMRRNLQTGGKETLVSSRKEAGQAEEGVAQTPTGKVWETMADLFVKPQAAGQITDQDYFMRSTDSQRVLRNNPWLATVPPETPVYIPQDVFRSSSFLNSFSADDLGFKHITDELANAMNPESGLPANLLLTPDEVANMGMEKAARHVIEVNKWREEQMGVANALRAQKSISLYKDYPTIPGKTEPNQRGLQWLELKLMPEDDTPESMVKAKEALADALKYEGEVMGHCVGGECPKVESGKSRIISLRDAKGEPHVTLEVIPPEVNFSDVLGGNPAFPNRDPELYRMMDTMTTTQIEKTPLYKEKAAAIAAQKLPGISQIKGKGNNRPPDSYQPFITDFIASQQWSSVGDLQNTNLVRIEPRILKNAQDRGFNPQIVTTIKERPYITKEEFNRLADLFGGMNKYAAGGEVTDFIKRAA